MDVHGNTDNKRSAEERVALLASLKDSGRLVGDESVRRTSLPNTPSKAAVPNKQHLRFPSRPSPLSLASTSVGTSAENVSNDATGQVSRALFSSPDRALRPVRRSKSLLHEDRKMESPEEPPFARVQETEPIAQSSSVPTFDSSFQITPNYLSHKSTNARVMFVRERSPSDPPELLPNPISSIRQDNSTTSSPNPDQWIQPDLGPKTAAIDDYRLLRVLGRGAFGKVMPLSMQEVQPNKYVPWADFSCGATR